MLRMSTVLICMSGFQHAYNDFIEFSNYLERCSILQTYAILIMFQRMMGKFQIESQQPNTKSLTKKI